MGDEPAVVRRGLLTGGIAAGLLVAEASAAAAATPTAGSAPTQPRGGIVPASQFGILGDQDADQTARLQEAIDRCAAQGAALVLPAGRIRIRQLQMREGSWLIGAARGTGLTSASLGAGLVAHGLNVLRLEGIHVDGGGSANGSDTALLEAKDCRSLTVSGATFVNAGGTALLLERVAGVLTNTTITHAGSSAIRAIDSRGLEISGCVISHCGDNGILIWRSKHAEDGTILRGNRISHVRAKSGGSGQCGNGINVFRAGSVLVQGNRITDCAFKAIRANEAGNVHIANNSCERLGEVALYVEAAGEQAGAPGFEGAVVANNLVDAAAAGISVTNFNNGGRLAVVQGNLVRNLFRRENDPRDKRGEGIAVEADAVVSGNVVEGAPTAGIFVGWGRYMRDVVVTSNLVRRSRIGIGVSGVPGAGRCLVSGNIISGAAEGAVRSMDHHRVVGADLVAGVPHPGIVCTANIAT